MIIHMGITGSREGMSGAQIQFLVDHLTSDEGPVFLHHGCCVGVDEEAHWLAFEMGFGSVGHPPADDRLMMPLVDDGLMFIELRPPKPYHDRNRDIVDESDFVLGFPKDDSGKGGTWYTINYARSAGVPVTVCHRDGTVEH
jgi:hypothetical protein